MDPGPLILLVAPPETAAEGADEAAMCIEGTAAAISLIQSWLQHPIVNFIVLH